MTEIAKLAAMLHPLERKVFPHVAQGTSTTQLIPLSKLSEVEVLRAVFWLAQKGLVQIEESEHKQILLGENGRKYAERGLPEYQLLQSVARGPGIPAEIGRRVEISPQEIGVSIGLLRARNAITMEGPQIRITPEGRKFLETAWPEQATLLRLAKGIVVPETELSPLRKRPLMIQENVQKRKMVHLTALGKQVLAHGLPEEDMIDQLTPEILRNGDWRGKSYRHYSVDTPVPHIDGGKSHFVQQAIAYIRQIWLEFGFQEMQGNIVQTAFWDLDTLFVPQDHPARQMQDTFYLKDGKQEDKILRGQIPSLLAKKIKAVHEHGGDTGSMGWGTGWSAETAAKVLLRTHTTVLSAQTLARLKETELPAKFFTVGPVFRNEALDWKHLFEFHQVEGIVVDPDANFSHLKAYLRTFYAKMGYPDVRLRPGYFPYVEPAIEVDVWHPEKKQWVELGGAGIFRPETVQPLLGKDIPVLAWGLGMGRIIAGEFGITDLRDLNQNDLRQLRETPWWRR